MRKIIYGLDDIKVKIMNMKGQNVQMSINRGRKRIEFVSATIKDVYPSVFTIKTEDEKLQTFSYFDVLCGNVILSESGNWEKYIYNLNFLKNSCFYDIINIWNLNLKN